MTARSIREPQVADPAAPTATGRVCVGVDGAVRPHDAADVAQVVLDIGVVVEILVLEPVLILVGVDPVVLRCTSLGRRSCFRPASGAGPGAVARVLALGRLLVSA
ncbi:MAG: hypothetical protein ACLP01_00470 [Solirubrobacteraceae bacterium]